MAMEYCGKHGEGHHVSTPCSGCEIEKLRALILRATAELEIVEYENDPPARVISLMDELRAVNMGVLLTPNVELTGVPPTDATKGG